MCKLKFFFFYVFIFVDEIISNCIDKTNIKNLFQSCLITEKNNTKRNDYLPGQKLWKFTAFPTFSKVLNRPV